LLARRGRYLVVFLLIVVGTGYLFTQIPAAFLPDEDQSLLMVEVRMPANASAERTEAVLTEIREYLLEEEADIIASVQTVSGFNFAGRGQNSGAAFVQLKDWALRSNDGQDVFSLTARAQERFNQIKDGQIMVFPPPAILEMGNDMGFNLYLQDNVGLGHQSLMAARDQFLQLANEHPLLTAVRPNGKDDEPQFKVNIDREKARAHSLSIAAINETMSAAWGSM